jgi:hypothetical protein
MNDKNSVHSHSNDYYQLDYYDYQDMESNHIGREDYSFKQQDTDIINKRLGPIPTSLERQDNILTSIGPGLVGILVLISSVSAIVSISAACASVAVAEMNPSVTSNSMLK